MNIYDLFKFDERNEEILVSLFNGYKNDPCSIIPFVGAGMTAFAYPTWGEFLANIYDKLYVDQKVENFYDLRYEEAAELLKKARTPLYFNQDLLNTFSEDKLENFDLTKENISYIPKAFKSVIITTNFDRTIEKLIPSIPVGRPDDTKLLTRAINNNLQVLFKFHGCISRVEDIVLTQTDYKKYYYENSELVKNLSKIFFVKHMLFLGCSLKEDRTVDIIESVFLEGNNFHYAIIDCKESERMKIRNQLGNKGIFTILIPEREYDYIELILSTLVNKEKNNIYNLDDLAITQKHELSNVLLNSVSKKENSENGLTTISSKDYISLLKNKGLKNAVELIVKVNSKVLIDNFIESTHNILKQKTTFLFTKYLYNFLMKHSMLNSISPDKTFILEEIYCPLILLGNDVKMDQTISFYNFDYFMNANKIDQDVYCLDEKCFTFINEKKKILIVDNAGMGKSTIMKYIACISIRLCKAIPILLEFRKIGSRTLKEYIYDEIASFGIDISDDDFSEILKNKELLFLFDGIDELYSENKRLIINEINLISINNPNARFIVSSRPDVTLNDLLDFNKYTIKRFNKYEATELIEKIIDKNLHYIFKEHFFGLGWHENPKIPYIEDLLSSPMLITLFAHVFNKKGIPESKSKIYVDIFESVFDYSSNSTNRKLRCNLSYEQIYTVLMEFARITYNSEKTVFSRMEIIRFLRKITKDMQIILNENYLLHDITIAMPFLVQEGFIFRWLHKSFLEFFYASWIVHNKQFDVINRLINSRNVGAHYSVLSFCYDMDFCVCDKIIGAYLLKKILNFEKSKSNDIEYKYHKYKQKGYLFYMIKQIENHSSFWGLIPLLRNKHEEIFKRIHYFERDKDLDIIISRENIYGIATRFSRGSNDEVYADILEVLTFDSCRDCYNKIINSSIL